MRGDLTGGRRGKIAALQARLEAVRPGKDYA